MARSEYYESQKGLDIGWNNQTRCRPRGRKVVVAFKRGLCKKQGQPGTFKMRELRWFNDICIRDDRLGILRGGIGITPPEDGESTIPSTIEENGFKHIALKTSTKTTALPRLARDGYDADYRNRAQAG